MSNVVFSDYVRTLVRSRSSNCCEYCKSQDKFSPVFFTIDHIVPPNQGGSHDPDNLAYACLLCNRLKWNKLTSYDPVTQTIVRIFHPREDVWSEHFQWSEDFLYIVSITQVGRGTVSALQLNREKLVAYRKEMSAIGQHPPVFP